MSEATRRRVALEIQALASERFGWEGALLPEMRLVEDLGLDSLKALELAVSIENHFRIRLDEASEEGIVSVGDLIEVVSNALSSERTEEE